MPQLINRGAVHLPDHGGHLADRRNEDDVSALEPHIRGLAPGEDVTVEIRVLVDLIVTNDPHVPHRAARSRSARVVQRVQNGRDRGNRVSAGPHHVTQDENLDRSKLP